MRNLAERAMNTANLYVTLEVGRTLNLRAGSVTCLVLFLVNIVTGFSSTTCMVVKAHISSPQESEVLTNR